MAAAYAARRGALRRRAAELDAREARLVRVADGAASGGNLDRPAAETLARCQAMLTRLAAARRAARRARLALRREARSIAARQRRAAGELLKARRAARAWRGEGLTLVGQIARLQARLDAAEGPRG
jgi:hypothetical protein